MAEDRNLRQALAYARHGWPVFPVIPGEKIPATANGFKDATTDPARIRAWWERNPGRNIGVATGRPGPDVVDVDRHGPQASGFPAWNAARREGLLARPMAIVRTPSGGMHAYFAGSDQRSAATAAHVDFRSQGGYVVAPHSTVGGRPYVVVQRDPESTAGVDFGAVRRLIDPQREREHWEPPTHLRGGGQQNLDHLVHHMAGLDDGRKRYLFWAANRVLDHGQPERLEDLARAAEAAGSDPRQIARTIESARQQQRQDPHSTPHPRGPVRPIPRRQPTPAAGARQEPVGQEEPQRGRVAVLEADRDGPEVPDRSQEPVSGPGADACPRCEKDHSQPMCGDGREWGPYRPGREADAEPTAAGGRSREAAARPFAQSGAEPEHEREAGE